MTDRVWWSENVGATTFAAGFAGVFITHSVFIALCCVAVQFTVAMLLENA